MAGEDSEESRGGDEMSRDYNESERQDTSRGRSRVRNEDRRERTRAGSRVQEVVFDLEDDEEEAVQEVLRQIREKKAKEQKLRELEKQAAEIKRQKFELEESLRIESLAEEKNYERRVNSPKPRGNIAENGSRDAGLDARDRYSGKAPQDAQIPTLDMTDAASHRLRNGVKEPPIEVPKLEVNGSNFNSWRMSLLALMDQLGYHNHIIAKDGGKSVATNIQSWERDDIMACAQIRSKLHPQTSRACGDSAVSARDLFEMVVDIIRPATDSQMAMAWSTLTNCEWNPDTPIEMHVSKFEEARLIILDCQGFCPSNQWRVLLLKSLKADPFSSHPVLRNLYHELAPLKNSNFNESPLDDQEWKKRLYIIEREVRSRFPAKASKHDDERINNSRSVFQRVEHADKPEEEYQGRWTLRGSTREREKSDTRLAKNQCAFCKKPGHWHHQCRHPDKPKDWLPPYSKRRPSTERQDDRTLGC